MTSQLMLLSKSLLGSHNVASAFDPWGADVKWCHQMHQWHKGVMKRVPCVPVDVCWGSLVEHVTRCADRQHTEAMETPKACMCGFLHVCKLGKAEAVDTSEYVPLQLLRHQLEILDSLVSTAHAFTQVYPYVPCQGASAHSGTVSERVRASKFQFPIYRPITNYRFFPKQYLVYRTKVNRNALSIVQ